MAKSPEQLSVLLGTATLPGLFERLGFTEPYQIEEFYASNFYELLRNLWKRSVRFPIRRVPPVPYFCLGFCPSAQNVTE